MPTKTITPWEFGPYVTEPVRNTVSALLWALHDNGGTIRDESGRVGGALRDLAVARGMYIPPKYQASSKTASGGLSSLYASLEMDTYGTEAIEREKNGTRSFEITLLLEDEEMPPKPVMIKKTLGDSTKPIEHPVDVSERTGERQLLEDGWDDIDAPAMAPDMVDTADISSFEIGTIPDVIVVSDTPDPYGLVIDAQRSITRALLAMAKDAPVPVDHTELMALRARVNVLSDELANVRAERDRLTEILTNLTIGDTMAIGPGSPNGAAS